MRDVEHRAEHIADAVTGAHRHATGERRHRQPRADLAIEPRFEVAGSALTRDSRAPAATARAGLRVGIGVRLARADALDAMVDRPDAGRQTQPFRRVHRHRRIEHHGARDDPGDGDQFLDPVPLVGDPGMR